MSSPDPRRYLYLLFERSKTREDWEAARRELEEKLLSKPDPHQTSDLAAVLIHLGEHSKAISMLEALEKSHPGEYVTAANLGTAYELAGDDEKALTWIRECLRRNPEAHQGTEWLHAKILEAKRALKADPGWLKKNHILGLDYGNGELPEPPVAMPDPPGNLESASDALVHQLAERLQFISPPDQVVADLLFDLGNTKAITLTLEHAAVLYGKSLQFSPADPQLVQKREQAANKIAAMGALARSRSKLILATTVVVLVAFVASVCVGLIRRAGQRPAGGSAG